MKTKTMIGIFMCNRLTFMNISEQNFVKTLLLTVWDVIFELILDVQIKENPLISRAELS